MGLRSELPSVVVLGSLEEEDSIDGVLSRKYLGSVSPGGAYDVEFYYRFSVKDPVSKFALEPAKSGQGLVNVRSCYTNKYWSRPHPNVTTIIAVANEPDEDTSSYKCTLFKPNLVDYEGQDAVQFLHIQTGRYLVLYWSDHPYYRFLMVSQSDEESTDNALTSILVDYESLVFLPKQVVFRGSNGKFLQPTTDGNNYLQFAQTDLGSEMALHEIVTTSDGRIQVKNVHLGKFWRRTYDNNSNWIKADVDSIRGDANDDPNTLFEVVKASDGNGIVALRNIGNKKFCKLLTSGGQQDCVDASASSIVTETMLDIFEPVITREIKEVVYRMDAARISGVTPMTMTQSFAENEGDKDAENSVEFKLSETRSTSWENSFSIKGGVKTEFQTGIPFIAEGKIEVSVESEYGHNWGTTIETTTESTVSYKVQVPPKSKVKVSVLATKGTCEVPFAYTQVDWLKDGRKITTTLNDGVFHGVNYFGVHSVSSAPEPIDD